LLSVVGLLAVAGCLYPVRDDVDHTVCDIADHLIDPEPLPTVLPAPTSPTQQATQVPVAGKSTNLAPPTLLPVSAQAPAQPVPGRPRLQIPPDLPGAEAPAFDNIPPVGPQLDRFIEQAFPALPDLGPNPLPVQGPDSRPFALADLQRLAMSNSPVLRAAAADVRAAEGAARQAGAYPNPTVGYEADTAGTGGTAGYQGFFFDQTIRTGGKLKLSQAMAVMDLQNSRIALRHAQTDLETQVRNGYFAVLIAQENMRVSAALARVTDEAYHIHLLLFSKGVAAYYEPTQLRVYAFQARGALVQARNTYLAAWKQLAAALGLPGLPPTELAGGIDRVVPAFDWDAALGRVITANTDVLTARVTEQRARYNLRLQQVTPVPDVNLHLVLQKDFTTPPNTLVSTVQVGLPVPMWDQNQGAIAQAQGQLVRAVEESHRVRDDLTSRLADAFQRYRSNLTLLEYYRVHILPDQVRFYRGVYSRRREDQNVQFTDIVNAQQTLATAIANYITTLTALWTAVSDMAGLLQTDDLFAVGGQHCLASGPDLAEQLQLPCYHPCSPLPDPALKGAAAGWPARDPGQPAPSAEPEFLLPAPHAAPTDDRAR
jgi:cobalt-zinc-cadmium efflux system outer membrane protein